MKSAQRHLSQWSAKSLLANASIICSALLASVSAHADWTIPGELNEFHPSAADRGVYLEHQYASTGQGGCSNPNTFFLSQSETLYKELVSLLSSSFLGGANIEVYVSGCSAQGYPLVRRVRMSR